MKQILAIAVGGAGGALLRYFVASGVHTVLGRAFPYGTLVVNVLGSGLMGILFVMFVERGDPGGVWRAGLMIGLLGAFTTFSTFSLETIALLETGALTRALLNVAASVGLCLLAAWAGVLAARAF